MTRYESSFSRRLKNSIVAINSHSIPENRLIGGPRNSRIDTGVRAYYGLALAIVANGPAHQFPGDCGRLEDYPMTRQCLVVH